MDETLEQKNETIDTKVAGAIPSLSDMTFEQLQTVSAAKRRSNSDRAMYKGNGTLKKVAKAVLTAGALFLSGMYVGASYSNELAEAGKSINSYFSPTAQAAENQTITYNGGK